MIPTQENSISAEILEALKKEIFAAVDEKFDVEAVAQMVEQLEFSKKVESKIGTIFQDRRYAENRNASSIASMQSELRDLIMDVALLKRALMSLGQIGVMERRRIEKELILELFPPKHIRPGLGIVVAQGQSQNAVEGKCEERIHLCQQACCRIFDVHLNADEVESEKFDWNPRSPYALHKNHKGCVHLIEGKCAIYHNRPATCYTYSCQQDSRIWEDYEKMILNPSLKQRLVSANLLPNEEESTASSSSQTEVIHPPDFSKLREMTVSEPANQFVPPPKPAEEVKVSVE